MADTDVDAVPVSRETEDELARHIIGMEASRAGIIRAAPARMAFRCFARALRGSQKTDLYQCSHPSSSIGAFWSHSWHGSRWPKIMTLFFLYNSRAAAITSLLGVTLVAIFFGAGLLPGMERPWAIYSRPRGFWVSVSGFFIYWLTMLFWQPCQRIFLDVLCIDQIDQRRKSLGIFNMGAFLKSSDSLLVLWDPTYTSRLWCIFELSAFLRSKKDPKLIIRPTVLGPCYLLLSLALAVLVSSFGALPDGHGIYDVMLVQGCLFGVGFYPIVASFREYFRSIDTLQSTLEHFSVQDTTCHCCRMNHVTFRGDPMVCDRRVLLTCISAWFGSEDSFDAVVRHDVLDRLMQQLCNEFLSYWQLITVMLPMFFPFIDAASAQWHYVGRYHHAVGRELLRGLAWWLGIAPTILLICLRVAYLLRKRCRCDFLLNILVLLCIVALWLAGVGIENEYLRIHRRLGGIHKIEAMAALAATFLPLAGLLFYFLGSHPGYKVRPGTSGCTGSSTGVQELHVQNKGGEADVAPSPEKFGIITL